MEEALARPLILATDNQIEPNQFLSIYNTYVQAIERVIGAPEGSLSLVDEIMLQSWIESVSNNIARIDPIDLRTTVLPLFPDRENLNLSSKG